MYQTVLKSAKRTLGFYCHADLEVRLAAYCAYSDAIGWCINLSVDENVALLCELRDFLNLVCDIKESTEMDV